MENASNVKIAVITDDGKTISQHFGRAAYYLVATLQDGQVIRRELRDKLGHAQLSDQPHAGDEPGKPHGMDHGSHQKHVAMAVTIADCQTLLCRGMGRGAYESIKAVGIRPVLTDIADIDAAILAYLSDTLVDHIERLH